MFDHLPKLLGGAAMAAGLLTTLPAGAADAPADRTGQAVVHHRSVEIQGIEIAYREAGDPTRPAILLLHGFPTSSHMFRDLIPVIGTRYHVIAPDYPGYGASAAPAVEEFDYSFANFAEIVDALVERMEVSSYALYVMDYGAPVGYRLFAKHPERVTGFVIQNGNAYEEGLREFWDPIRAYWADPSPANGDALRGFLTLDATRWQYTHGVGDISLVSPDNWFHDQYLLDRPGNREIQLAMFYDYRTNVPDYPEWQTLFRAYDPPALLVWGENDHIFPAEGAHPYKRDLTDLEFHLLPTGHFALEEFGSFIAGRMLDFLDRMHATN